MEFPCYSSVISESFHLQRNVLAYPLIDLLDNKLVILKSELSENFWNIKFCKADIGAISFGSVQKQLVF
jgi:hypothetical protein